MGSRAWPAVVLLAALVLALDIVLLQWPSAPAPAAQATPAPTPAPATSPTAAATTPPATATATPTDAERIKAHVDQLEALITTPALALLRLAGLLLGAAVIGQLVLLLFFRPPQLVVENLSNASGDDKLTPVLAGLSQLMRETLLAELRELRRRLPAIRPQLGLPAGDADDLGAYPQASADQTLATLLTSLKDVTPKELNPVVQLASAVFPAAGTRVTGTVQQLGDAPEQLGLTFELADMQGQEAPTLFTVWQTGVAPAPAEPAAKPGLAEAMGVAEAPAPAKQPGLAASYHGLLPRAMRRLALELTRRSLLREEPGVNDAGYRRDYHARVYNLLGALNLASGDSHGAEFYLLAYEDFTQAIELAPRWYAPAENLAETAARLAQQPPAEAAAGWRAYALLKYRAAFDLAPVDGGRGERATIRDRIALGEAAVKLATDDPALVAEACQWVAALERHWEAASEPDWRCLYNLASWYAQADTARAGVAEARSRVLRYAAYSLVRNRDGDLWGAFDVDPAFAARRLELVELRQRLARALQRQPELATLTGEALAAAINEILLGGPAGPGRDGR